MRVFGVWRPYGISTRNAGYDGHDECFIECVDDPNIRLIIEWEPGDSPPGYCLTFDGWRTRFDGWRTSSEDVDKLIEDHWEGSGTDVSIEGFKRAVESLLLEAGYHLCQTSEEEEKMRLLV